jgi:hypothetical protein
MAIPTRQHRGKASVDQQDARRFPRQRVSWLVTVSAGSREFHGRTKDTSAGGAKILLKERLPLGTSVALQFRPPGQVSVTTRALVWRADPDGLACMFVGTQAPQFLSAVSPPLAGSTPAASDRPEARTILALAEPRGMRPLVAHCHLELGKLHRRTGNGQRAHEHLTTAITMYCDRCNAYQPRARGHRCATMTHEPYCPITIAEAAELAELAAEQARQEQERQATEARRREAREAEAQRRGEARARQE